MDKNKKLYIVAFTASLFGILCFAALALAARYLLIISDMSWQYLHAIMGLVLGMVLLIVIMVFGWILVLNRNRKINFVENLYMNFVENLYVNKDKQPYIALFVVSLFSTLYMISSAASAWRILSSSDVEPWRFWTALIGFILTMFLVIAGIIGCILCLVRIVQNKKKNQNSLVES